MNMRMRVENACVCVLFMYSVHGKSFHDLYTFSLMCSSAKTDQLLHEFLQRNFFLFYSMDCDMSSQAQNTILEIHAAAPPPPPLAARFSRPFLFIFFRLLPASHKLNSLENALEAKMSGKKMVVYCQHHVWYIYRHFLYY